MFELVTQILILVAIYFLVRFVLTSFISTRYLTWFGGFVIILLIILAFLAPTNRTIGILWSILSFPLRPLGLSLILLGYALSLGTIKVWLKGSQVLAAFMILLISSLPLTAYLLIAQTEQRTALEATQRPVDSNVTAIVVMGDGNPPADPTTRIRTQIGNVTNGLSVTLESRLLYAADLYKEQGAQGANPQMIVSVGPQTILSRPGVTVTQAIQTFLNNNGVPIEQVKVDAEGVDARSSAVAVRRILLGPGAVSDCRLYAVCSNGVHEVPTTEASGPKIPIILISPALNIRRVSSTFAHLNFHITPRPTDFYVFQSEGGLRLTALGDLIPSADALALTTRVVDEYWATVYYFMRGWLSDPLGV